MSGMRIGMDLSARMDQKMILAPRMIQSMEILQLPIIDLQAKIEKELQENPFLEQKEKWRPYVPSPTGMGIAMLIPVNAVTMIFLGALGDTLWARMSPEKRERYSVPVAAGLIAGEALVAVVIPLLVTVGFMSLP